MNKRKLNLAFAELKTLGYTAEQNFQCCQNCAWSALSDEEAEKAVFYHGQDNDDLKETGSCYLAWSGDGKEIVSVLEKHGIEVDWSGENGKRIKITL